MLSASSGLEHYAASLDRVSSSCQIVDWCLTLSQNVQTETH